MARIDLKHASVSFIVHGARKHPAEPGQAEDSDSQARVQFVRGRLFTHALRDLNISFVDGDRVGVIGRNGAGKTTLLRLITGILQPTSGRVIVDGGIAALISVSLGFDQKATGEQNVYRRGMLMGLSRQQIRERLPDIANFAELGEYMHLPVENYSAGMLTRLGFAVTTAVDADVVVMDEWIGAGDKRFLERGRRRLMNVIERSRIFVIASHNETLIKRLCNKALILDGGRIIAYGSTSLIDKADVIAERARERIAQQEGGRLEAGNVPMRQQELG